MSFCPEKTPRLRTNSGALNWKSICRREPSLNVNAKTPARSTVVRLYVILAGSRGSERSPSLSLNPGKKRASVLWRASIRASLS